MAVGFSDTDYKQDIPVNLGIRGRPVIRTVLIDSAARDGGHGRGRTDDTVAGCGNDSDGGTGVPRALRYNGVNAKAASCAGYP